MGSASSKCPPRPRIGDVCAVSAGISIPCQKTTLPIEGANCCKIRNRSVNRGWWGPRRVASGQNRWRMWIEPGVAGVGRITGKITLYLSLSLRIRFNSIRGSQVVQQVEVADLRRLPQEGESDHVLQGLSTGHVRMPDRKLLLRIVHRVRPRVQEARHSTAPLEKVDEMSNRLGPVLGIRRVPWSTLPLIAYLEYQEKRGRRDR